MPEQIDPLKAKLLDAALVHVPFDGWSETTFTAAIRDTGTDPAVADTLCPRGAVDLAIAFHKRGDAAMVDRLKSEDLSNLRFSEKVAAAVRFRIEAIESKEAVRRGTTLFALPHLAADGAKLIWGTSDLIWDTLGDSSTDVNWYTKRASLSGVYGSAVLFWLGDDSSNCQSTWAFIDRRIDDVMRIEKIKSRVNANPLLSRLATPVTWVGSRIKPPLRTPKVDLPGSWSGPY